MKNNNSNAYFDLLDRLKQREDLLRIFILTVFTVFCWVGLSIYLSQQKTKIPDDIQRYALPLNPTINRSALEEIQTRKAFTDEELKNFTISTPIEVVASPLSSPATTPEPETPVATESAQ